MTRWWDVPAELIMYASVGVFILSGLVLLGYVVTGVDTLAHFWTRFVVALVWVSAFFALLSALAVIFG